MRHSAAIRLALIGALSMVSLGALAATDPYSSGAVVTGGVTEEGREEMMRRAGPYNLRLAFAEKDTGAYLASVKVTVVDQSGKPVVDVVTDGPWLFAQVAPGTYTVRAQGAPEQRVTVGASGPTVAILRFGPQP